MTEAPRLLRFCGKLWETMKFEREVGWETTRTFDHRKEGDGEYRVELRDKDGHLLVYASPVVDFGRYCSTGSEVRRTRVVCYVPFHERAAELVLRRGELIIYRELIAPGAPSIELHDVKRLDEDHYSISWTAKSDDEKSLTYRVACLVDQRRGFLLGKDLKENQFEADLTNVPGGKDVRFGVLASDGIRSDYVVSEPVEIPEKPPQVWIQSPDPDQTYAPDQPLSLLGQATDIAGAPLPDDGLVWRFDGEQIASGTRMSLSRSAEPGSHLITLEYVQKKTVVAEETIGIKVADRNEHHKRYQDILRELPKSQ